MKVHNLTFISLILTSFLLHTGTAAATAPAAPQPPYACHSSDPKTKSYPFCKTTLPINQRVQDLVSRLTLDEKISQLVHAAAAIPRLGVPAYVWWSEALHGVAYVADVVSGIDFSHDIKSATSFPQVILTASSFDSHLWYRIGQAIGTEARGMYNGGQAQGMTFWAPNINIYRDPRWGRGHETSGEDPSLTGAYAISYVRGIQGDSYDGTKLKAGDRLQASACCKHFTAYDLDSWKGIGRFYFNAQVSKQDLADSYMPPFQSCIQKGKASGIMCAYNRVNGIPNCANYDLLTNTARKQWGFNGYITSDCDAVSIIYEKQGYAKSPEDAVADVLKAGMDVNCGDYLKNYTGSAVREKKVPVYQIDRALHNLFTVRMRLGLFDGEPNKLLFGNITSSQICSKEHLDLALEAAKHGIVLLKNNDKLLPFSKTQTRSLAVIGPNANVAVTLQANYKGPPCRNITALQALKMYVKDARFHQGCNSVGCNISYISEAVKIAKGADRVVLVMGLDLTQEREEFDRDDLVLPGKQQELISAVARAAKKAVVLVLICGGPVDVSFAKNDPHIGSIIWAGYPGEAGALALAEIIFGDHNPGGRLPMTWYPQSFTKVNMTDMRMRPDPSSGYPGRTYRFYTGPKVFEFGYGLSYTKFSYEFVSVSQTKLYFSQQSSSKDSQNIRYKLVSEMNAARCEDKKVQVKIGVTNGGEMAGKHPVLLFVRQGVVGNGRAIKTLVGFQSVDLSAGGNAHIEFELSPCEHLSRANEDGLMVIEEGSHFLQVEDQEYEISNVIE